MTDDEFHRWLYKAGTGWLGWPPETVLECPIPMLCLSIEGCVDWQKMTHGVKD